MPPLPDKPAQALEAAAKVNGLDGADVKPWHLKISYQIYDEGGNPQTSGTFEEYWVMDKKYRRSYKSDRFSQVEFGTDHGIYRSGSPEWPAPAEAELRTDVVHPISQIDLKTVDLQRKERTFGTLSLDCLIVHFKGWGSFGSPFAHPHYCFDKSDSMLRYSSNGEGMDDVVYNNIALFDGHWIARNVRVEDRGKARITLQVDTIEGLASINESDFLPTQDAAGPITPRAFLKSGQLQQRIVNHAPPHYPDKAKSDRIQGSVRIRVVVGKDGRVLSTEPLSGPALLQSAAVDAVKQWSYRPYVVSGEPVEIVSEVIVNFTLGY